VPHFAGIFVALCPIREKMTAEQAHTHTSSYELRTKKPRAAKMQQLFGDVWGCGRNCTSERADLQTLNLLPAWRSLSEMVSVDASLPPVSTKQAK